MSTKRQRDAARRRVEREAAGLGFTLEDLERTKATPSVQAWRFEATPAALLPQGVHALTLRFEHEVVVRMDNRYVTPLMAEALSEAFNDYAQQVGIPTGPKSD